MRTVIEVDQSNKIEQPRSTTIAFSDGVSFAIILPHYESRKCSKLWNQNDRGCPFYRPEDRPPALRLGGHCCQGVTHTCSVHNGAVFAGPRRRWPPDHFRNIISCLSTRVIFEKPMRFVSNQLSDVIQVITTFLAINLRHLCVCLCAYLY